MERSPRIHAGFKGLELTVWTQLLAIELHRITGTQVDLDQG